MHKQPSGRQLFGQADSWSESNGEIRKKGAERSEWRPGPQIETQIVTSRTNIRILGSTTIRRKAGPAHAKRACSTSRMIVRAFAVRATASRLCISTLKAAAF